VRIRPGGERLGGGGSAQGLSVADKTRGPKGPTNLCLHRVFSALSPSPERRLTPLFPRPTHQVPFPNSHHPLAFVSVPVYISPEPVLRCPLFCTSDSVLESRLSGYLADWRPRVWTDPPFGFVRFDHLLSSHPGAVCNKHRRR
jgi:hypothetical protein